MLRRVKKDVENEMADKVKQQLLAHYYYYYLFL